MERKGKQSRSKARFWSAHFLAWQKSGLSQREYCSRCNLRLSTFSWWRRKLRQKEMASLALIPVALPDRPEEIENGRPIPTGLSLVVGRRCRIEIGTGFHAGTFARLISVLEDM